MASYFAAYLTKESAKLFTPFGCKDSLHMTLFFDKSDEVLNINYPNFEGCSARISNISEWLVGDKIYIVAELDHSEWSFIFNDYVASLISHPEDLPHKPHVTLNKDAKHGDSQSYSSLLGKWIDFDEIKLKKVKNLVS